MIGRTEGTAAPQVLFCCSDVSARKAIRNTIAKSGIMEKYPGVGLGDMPSLPVNHMPVQLASEDVEISGISDKPRAVLSDSFHVFLGSRIYAQEKDDSLRYATAGFVAYAKNHTYCLTAGHVFRAKTTEIPAVASQSPLDECDFDGLDDWDDDFEPDDHDELDVAITSRGSATPEDLQSSCDSIPLDEASIVEGDSRNINAGLSMSQYPSEASDPSFHKTDLATVSHGLAPIVRVDHAPQRSQPVSSDLKHFGTLELLSDEGSRASLDYALIKLSTGITMTNEVQISSGQILHVTKVAEIGTDDIDIVAVTSSEDLQLGRLSASPLFLKFPHDATYQEVFPVQLEGAVSNGDCGSAVLDCRTGDLYGHVVAGGPHTGIAYIIAAAATFADIESLLGVEIRLAARKTPLKSNLKTAAAQVTSKDTHVRFTPQGKPSGLQYESLIAIIEKNDISALEKALESVTDLNQYLPFRQETALHIAARMGRPMAVCLLLTHGANADILDRHQKTANQIAWENHFVRIEAVLFFHSCFKDVKRDEPEYPLHWACASGIMSALSRPMKNLHKIDHLDNAGRTGLWYASAFDRKKMARMLLGRGAKGDECGYGDSPLHVACVTGHISIVKLIVQSGANINVRSHQLGDTPLSRACAYGHLEVARVLVSVGADVDSSNNEGFTPLHFACQHGHIEICRFLLGAGANFNALTTEQATPLGIACRSGQEEVVHLLIAAGADVNATDDKLWSPLHIASQNGNKKVVQLLIRARASVNATNDEGWTPLHYACHHGHLHIVRALIDAGAWREARNQWGTTPFLTACWNGHVKTVSLLIDLNADISVKNESGQGYEQYLQRWRDRVGNPETRYTTAGERRIKDLVRGADRMHETSLDSAASTDILQPFIPAIQIK